MAVEIDIESKAEGQYRIVVWTIGPSVERKYSKLVELGADVVVAARSGSEVRLLKANRNVHSSMAWVGRHVQRGLGVIGFDRSRVRLDAGKWDQRLEWIAPITVTGPIAYSMLAVWALNEKAQVSFKSKPPASQPHQMMRLYKSTLEKPTVVAGDFNNNPIFHRNDPNWDMLELIALLKAQRAGECVPRVQRARTRRSSRATNPVSPRPDRWDRSSPRRLLLYPPGVDAVASTRSNRPTRQLVPRGSSRGACPGRLRFRFDGAKRDRGSPAREVG